MVRDRLCGIEGDPDKRLRRRYAYVVRVQYVRTYHPHAARATARFDDPEDCDTDGEDHAPDALRYGFMSRPWRRPKPPPKVEATVKLLQNATMNDLWEAHERR
jgi:hypothetical protein